MDGKAATLLLESLASGVRLEVVRLLAKRGHSGMVAGEIATTLDVPPTNLSFHLKALTVANLATVTQQGRFQRYRANIPLMLELIAYLSKECCAIGPGQCGEMGDASRCGAEVLSPLSKPQSAQSRS